MKLPFDGLSLNEGQEAGLTKIVDWLGNPHSPQVFRLVGRAGTGKSLLVAAMFNGVAALNQALKLFNLPETIVKLTATTNQAAEELNSKIKTADVEVIHSYLSLTVKEYQDKTYLTSRKNTKVTDNLPLSVVTGVNNLLLVIDESSYVGKELLPYLQELMKYRNGIKVMFVYDDKQLLPVDEDHCLIDEVYNNTNSVLHELTQNERFNSYDNSAIAVAADSLCTVIGFDSLDIPEIEEGEDLEFISSDDALDIALKHFSEHEYRWNPNHMLYTAHTNLNVVEANKILYSSLEGQSHPFTTTGIHLVNNSIYAPLKTPILRNNQKVTLVDSYKDYNYLVTCSTRFHGIDVVSLKIIRGTNTKHQEQIYVNVALDSTKYLNALNAARKSENWNTYFELKNGVADLRLSYASTVYKAQGKSCNFVMVDVADILEKSRTLDEAKRLLYVAITRARKKVYLIWD